MASLEELCMLSSDTSYFCIIERQTSLTDNSHHSSSSLSPLLLSRLVKLTLPIHLSTIYSKKKQELLFTLLNHYPSLSQSVRAKIIDHSFQFLQATLKLITSSVSGNDGAVAERKGDREAAEEQGERNNERMMVLVNSCESGFFHRFMRELLRILASSSDAADEDTDEEGNEGSDNKQSLSERFVALLIQIFQKLVGEFRDDYRMKKLRPAKSSNGKEYSQKEEFGLRNRLIMIQEFLHVIGITSTSSLTNNKRNKNVISWAATASSIAEVGKICLKSLNLDTEFACGYMIKLLTAMRTVLTEIIQSPSASATASRESFVLMYYDIAETLLQQKEKAYYKKTMEEIALVITLYATQLLQNRTLIPVCQYFLSYFQCFGQKALVDSLLVLLIDRYDVSYELHPSPFSWYSSFLTEIDLADPTLIYHQFMEVERMLSVFVMTLWSFVLQQNEVVIEAVQILSAYFIRHLGCLFDTIKIDVHFRETRSKGHINTTFTNFATHSAKKIFEHIVNILSMERIIRDRSQSEKLIKMTITASVLSADANKEESFGAIALSFSPFEQLIFYLRDKISLFLQTIESQLSSHHPSSSISSSSNTFLHSTEADHPIIQSVLYLLLFSQLSITPPNDEFAPQAFVTSEVETVVKGRSVKRDATGSASEYWSWLFDELIHFNNLSDLPQLVQFMNTMHCELLLDYYDQLSISNFQRENSKNLKGRHNRSDFHLSRGYSYSFWKHSVVNLLDYLWMKLDSLFGKIFNEMEGDSTLSALKVDDLIRIFGAYSSNISSLVGITLAAITEAKKEFNPSDEFFVIVEIESYFIPFLNAWMCFILRCFSFFDSTSGHAPNGTVHRLYMTYRVNSILSITEYCFHIFANIFQYQYIGVLASKHLSSSSPISAAEISYEEILSIKTCPNWKWYLRFWLLVNICEIKFQTLWNQRKWLQAYERSILEYSIPLYLGLKTLAESSSIDIMKEYIANDKEILSILSISRKEDIAAYCHSCASVMQNHNFDVYFAVIYQLERKRILYNLEMRPCIILFIESLSWPSPQKRFIAEKMFTELRKVWVGEVKLRLLDGPYQHPNSQTIEMIVGTGGSVPHSPGERKGSFDAHLIQQIFSLLKFCYDERQVVRFYCQQCLLDVFPYLQSNFLLGKLNLLHYLLSSAFELEAVYEEMELQSRGQHPLTHSNGLTNQPPGATYFTDIIKSIFSKLKAMEHSSSSALNAQIQPDLFFSSLPNALYPTNQTSLLHILSTNFSLIYAILYHNQQLSEITKQEQLKEFLSGHVDQLNDTVLLVQEYLNQRIQIILLNETSQHVHVLRLKVANELKARNAGDASRYGEKAVKDLHLLYPTATKSVESILFVKPQTLVENSVSGSLFSSRSALRKQLQGYLKYLTEGKIEQNTVYETLVSYQTIIFHHHLKTSQPANSAIPENSAISLDLRDYLFYLKFSCRFLIEHCHYFPYCRAIIENWEKLITNYPVYRELTMSVLLSGMQSALFYVGFSARQRTEGEERKQQDFNLIVEFLRRMLLLKNVKVLEMIRLFVERLLSEVSQHHAPSALSPSLINNTVFSSFSNCYALIVLGFAILQHSAITMLENQHDSAAMATAMAAPPLAADEEAVQTLPNANSDLISERKHFYPISIRIHSILREKLLSFLLLTLRIQLEKGGTSTDVHLSLQQQYLLEIMHYLVLDSRRWTIEQTQRVVLDFERPKERLEEEEAELSEVLMIHSLFPARLFFLPFTSCARFHHSRVQCKVASTVLLTLAERIQSYSLCGKRKSVEAGKEGEEDHCEFPHIEQWKRIVDSQKHYFDHLSGVGSVLWLLCCRMVDHYQAKSDVVSLHNSSSSSTALTKGLYYTVPCFPASLYTNLQSNKHLFAKSMKSAWMISAQLSSLLYHISFDHAVQEQKTRLDGLSTFSHFLTIAASQNMFNWTADYFVGCIEALTASAPLDVVQKSTLLSAFHVLQRTTQLPEILSVLARCDSFSKQYHSAEISRAIVQLPHFTRYCIRSIHQISLNEISFYLPQLIQLLRFDYTSHYKSCIQELAQRSPQFCHQLIWLLQTESKQMMKKPNHYGFCFELKGVDPLPSIAQQLLSSIVNLLSEIDQQFLQEEIHFFDSITHISGRLKDVKDKEQHPRVIREHLKELKITAGIYMPTNPTRKVIGIDFESAAPMQSAAKCPFLLKFVTVEWEGPDHYLASLIQKHSSSVNDLDSSKKIQKAIKPSSSASARKRVEIMRQVLSDEDEAAVQGDSFDNVTNGTVYFADGSQAKEKESLGGDSSSQVRVIATIKGRKGSKIPYSADEDDDQSDKLEFTTRMIPKSSAAPVVFTPQKSQPLDKPVIIQISGAERQFRVPKAAKEKLGGSAKRASFLQENIPLIKLSDACIFKVYDDCRQDIVTLQVVRLLKQYYESIGLPVYLAPYSIISNRTGDQGAIGGILQVIPSVHSRDQLGKAGFKTLKQYYLHQFGPTTSPAYQKAVKAFISSLAAYNVVCYLLHIKDRHNGNVLIDTDGHLIHIDFGFILGISPGGNMGFETAPFKLTQEMIELIGGENSEGVGSLESLTTQAFLAARRVKSSILATVNVFADSDLPCFQYKKSILERLYCKFFPSLSESEAKERMQSLLRDAMYNRTTAIYDGVQKLQNNVYSPEWK